MSLLSLYTGAAKQVPPGAGFLGNHCGGSNHLISRRLTHYHVPEFPDLFFRWYSFHKDYKNVKPATQTNLTNLRLRKPACLSTVPPSAAQPSSQRKERDDSVDNYLKMVLENFAEAMKTGIPILGIPVLDPLNVGSIDIPSIEGPEFSLQANASQLLISGLSSFSPTAVHVDFQQAALTLGLHIVTVRVDGQYWADGLLLSVFPIFGNGPFYIQIVSTDISGLGDVTVTPDDYLQIEDLQLAAAFDVLDVHFDNFLGGGSFGEIVSGVSFRSGGAHPGRGEAGDRFRAANYTSKSPNLPLCLPYCSSRYV
ncbi:uncharacterized protein LOC119583340 [Penaeus monodon]|uniref:uncharacterized protein LOC119583340 n=1 Tax=Penaeus monodon TaxID=6687 RepID=UPI0018A7709B|nr:uncharacterized protein LOC119583340 [Penaeus monodon]